MCHTCAYLHKSQIYNTDIIPAINFNRAACICMWRVGIFIYGFQMINHRKTTLLQIPYLTIRFIAECSQWKWIHNESTMYSRASISTCFNCKMNFQQCIERLKRSLVVPLCKRMIRRPVMATSFNKITIIELLYTGISL